MLRNGWRQFYSCIRKGVALTCLHARGKALGRLKVNENKKSSVGAIC